MSATNKIHQLMTIALLRKFNEDGFELIAASNFHDLHAPGQIGRHTPDVIGKDSDGNIHLGEAKLGENLDTEKTKEQISDFLKLRSPNGQTAHVHIITEEGNDSVLKTLLEDWGIKSSKIHIWTY